MWSSGMVDRGGKLTEWFVMMHLNYYLPPPHSSSPSLLPIPPPHPSSPFLLPIPPLHALDDFTVVIVIVAVVGGVAFLLLILAILVVFCYCCYCRNSKSMWRVWSRVEGVVTCGKCCHMGVSCDVLLCTDRPHHIWTYCIGLMVRKFSNDLAMHSICQD